MNFDTLDNNKSNQNKDKKLEGFKNKLVLIALEDLKTNCFESCRIKEKVKNTNNIKYQNRKTYDLLAQQYEEKAMDRKDNNLQEVSKFTSYITTGKEILDIGCAVGLDISIFKKLGYNIEGIDISNEMVKIARKKNPNTKIEVGDFLDTKFDKKYDAIFAQAFIHLYPKPEAQLVLKKNQITTCQKWCCTYYNN